MYTYYSRFFTNRDKGVGINMSGNTYKQRFNTIQEQLELKQRERDRVDVKIESTQEHINQYSIKVQDLEELAKVYGDVSQLYQNITRERTGEVKQVLEDVLNNALSRVPMDADYEAVLEGPDFMKANTTVEIKLVDRNSGKMRTPLVSTGTMVAQLISFLMTAIVIKFSGKRRLMVLDEVLSGFYDKDAIAIFGEILVALSQNEGFQFILVEHKSELEKVEGINILQVNKQSYDQGLVIESMTIGGDNGDVD